ncbi:hypothetical protein L0F63_001555 [Massospora cicadina]|nr:hypothetical protein L0F63_001555 [Massospora cicadina]
MAGQELEQVSVFALTAYEGYMEIDKHKGEYLTIVDKVDTSGFREITAGAKLVIRGYLAWREQLNYAGNHLVYVFARAQPQYIFRKSSENPLKRVLSDSQLIRWWKEVLSSSLFLTAKVNPNSDELCKFWFIPGLTPDETHNIDPSPSSGWFWGTPYPEDSVAKQVIFQLPDDAKSRLITTESGELKVKHFLDVLSHSEECGSGRRTGLFYLASKKEGCAYPTLEDALPGIGQKLVCNYDTASDDQPELSESLVNVEEIDEDHAKDSDFEDEINLSDEEEFEQEEQEVDNGEASDEQGSNEALDSILSALMEDADFSTADEAFTSTKLINLVLDSLSVPIWTASPHPSLILSESASQSSLDRQKYNKSMGSEPAPANLLTPRKKNADSKLSSVNVLTPKRKVPDQFAPVNDFNVKKLKN